MKSRTTARFWKLFDRLPPDVQRRARGKFIPLPRAYTSNELIQKSRSTRLELGWAIVALGLLESDTIYWFWIGSHDEYERELG